MAKRFTDTNKWKKEWYRKLPAKAKLFWGYFLDNCDVAGLWDVDFGLASYQIGMKIDESILKYFDGKFSYINENKIWLSEFIEYQYGQLSEKSNPHKAVIRILTKHNLLDSNSDLRVPEGYLGSLQDKDQDKAKDKDKDKEEKVVLGFEEIFELFPKRKNSGKSGGMISCRQQIKTHEDFELLKQATINYAEITKDDEPQYRKMFSTFMNCWRDFIQIEIEEKAIKLDKESIRAVICGNKDYSELEEREQQWVQDHNGRLYLGSLNEFQLKRLIGE